MLVSEILRSKDAEGVETIAPGASIGDAASVLSSKRYGALVVSSDGARPEGILSERDIVGEIGRTGADCLKRKVSDLMTRKLVTCTRDDTADHVLALMTDGRFRHLPVVEDGRMVGLISIGDVVKARLKELSFERDQLESMVAGH